MYPYKVTIICHDFTIEAFGIVAAPDLTIAEEKIENHYSAMYPEPTFVIEFGCYIP